MAKLKADEARRQKLQLEQEARAQQFKTEQEARAEASRRLSSRKAAAIPKVQMVVAAAKCWLDCDIDRSDLLVNIANDSIEALSRVTVGLAHVAANATCPLVFAERRTVEIKLSPGETRSHTFAGIDGGFRKNRVCVKILDVELAG